MNWTYPEIFNKSHKNCEWYVFLNKILARAATGGGRICHCPPRFFVDNGKTNLARLFLYLFYTLGARCYLLPWKVRWPGSFKWPDFTTPFFANLRPCQSQSRWPSALKVAGCNKPIATCNLYISDFYIDDLRSGRFHDLPIIIQWGEINWLIFHKCSYY